MYSSVFVYDVGQRGCGSPPKGTQPVYSVVVEGDVELSVKKKWQRQGHSEKSPVATS